ncbi:hypothetical protein Agub_g12716 [Astrephomene gubernaculifera]|uniref:Uncharacterized protein n=1 Tax=Astrephomene gubernaculifera TaxID=47775 RepID=A0AAD3E0I1_9CHLO|nr:hypothetical protein Agub_g3712 [Astrephomene gubernaculifera]GFR50627.1 hypothetical protein Agub_g12716 [Astrephomene gubernaculifera]
MSPKTPPAGKRPLDTATDTNTPSSGKRPANTDSTRISAASSSASGCSPAQPTALEFQATAMFGPQPSPFENGVRDNISVLMGPIVPKDDEGEIALKVAVVLISDPYLNRLVNALGNIVTINPVVGGPVQSNKVLGRLAQVSSTQFHIGDAAQVTISPHTRFIPLTTHRFRTLGANPATDSGNTSNEAPMLVYPYGALTEYSGRDERFKKLDAMVATGDPNDPNPVKMAIKSRASALTPSMARLLDHAAATGQALYINGYFDRKNEAFDGTVWTNSSFIFGAHPTRAVRKFILKAIAKINGGADASGVNWMNRLAQEWEGDAESTRPQDGLIRNAVLQPLQVKPSLTGHTEHVLPMALTHDDHHYAVYANTLDVVQHVPGYLEEFGTVEIATVNLPNIINFLQEPFEMHADVEVLTTERFTRITRLVPRA